jgi:hypothetical protein
VQRLGLEILMVLDRLEHRQAEEERLRQTLLAINPTLAKALYPLYDLDEDAEIVEVQAVTEDLDLHREDAAYDFGKVEWEMPSEMEDTEFTALQRMLGDAGITVSGPMEAPEGVAGGGESPSDDTGWM